MCYIVMKEENLYHKNIINKKKIIATILSTLSKLFKGKEYDENNWTKDSIRVFLFKSVLDLASNFELEKIKIFIDGRKIKWKK